MDKRLITQALQDQARKDIPEDMNMWPEMQQQLGSVSRRAARSRVTWVVAAVLALLAMSAIAYAAARLLQGQRLDPGLQGANEADLVTVLNMQQIHDGQTMTLDYAYADSNRISFSLTASGTTLLDIDYRFDNVELTDDAGHNFQAMFGGGGGGGGGSGGGSDMTTTDYSSNISDSVDASVITDMPDTLNLHLSVTLGKYQTAPPDATEMPHGQMPQEKLIKMLDPFVFDFTIPFIHGQVVNPDQTITANGITMHMGRMVIAPSLTRSPICIMPLSESSGYSAHVSLKVDGSPISLSDYPFDNDNTLQSFMSEEGLAAGCYDFQINQSLYNYPGRWELSIDNLVTYLGVGQRGGEDGTTVEQGFFGTPDLLAEIRAKLEPQLKPYGIELREEDGSLTFSYPSSTDQDVKNALQQIANQAILVETPGPWVFTFDVPPAR